MLTSALRSLIIIATLVGMAGCVPVVSTIYRPVIEGGKLIETSCGYTSAVTGRWDKVEFDHAGIKVRVQALEGYEGFAIITSYLVPANTTLQFVDAYANVASLNTGVHYKLEADNLRQYLSASYKSLPVTHPVEGATYFKNGEERTQHYEAAFQAPQKINGDLEATLPNALINQKKTEFPKIRFHEDRTFYLQSLNC